MAQHKRQAHEVRRVVDGQAQRNCKDCAQWLPATLSYFYACPVSKDGLQVRCKPCHSARSYVSVRERRARRRAINNGTYRAAA